ncbi:MAG TPA: Hsp20/alpha crystallin family protein [Stellaceae bacterium]|nr:Hsp20/alpha crystallin family protein [Stellaceae bacterium]
MAITDLIPWARNRNLPAPRQTDEHPFLALHREVNRMFDNFFRGFDWPTSAAPGWPLGGWPRVEVSESDNEVTLVAELPGMEERDVELTFREGMLIFKGEKKAETNDAVYSERWHGQFERAVQLGPDVDPEKIKAEFKNGVLIVTVGKRPEAQRQVKRIAINA